MAHDNEPILRYYTPEDYLRLCRCMEALQNYERTLEFDRIDGACMADQYVREILRNVEQKNGEIFIMEYEGNILGFLSIWIERPVDACSTIRQYAFISDLVVLEAHRGFHLGSRLMDMAEEYAMEQGVEVIKLNVLARNTVALEFYHNLGYRDYEVVEIKYLVPETEEFSAVF